MKTLTIACNIVLAAFTALVLATDGASREPADVLLTVLLFLIPLANVLVITRRGTARPIHGPGIERAAALANILLLGFISWAIVDRYPHPAEPGFFEYVALLLFTPVSSTVVLFRARGGEHGRAAAHRVAPLQ